MKKVYFTDRAYTKILQEVYEHGENETGGVLLGHRDEENDIWYVIESVPPGPKSIHRVSYYEYDHPYAEYELNKLAKQYYRKLQLLGMWHKHPGRMNTFSSTDDATNLGYAGDLNGAISGIVNVADGFEMTMYYVPETLAYEKTECIFDESKIPKKYFESSSKYYEDLIAKRSQSFTRQDAGEQSQVEDKIDKLLERINPDIMRAKLNKELDFALKKDETSDNALFLLIKNKGDSMVIKNVKFFLEDGEIYYFNETIHKNILYKHGFIEHSLCCEIKKDETKADENVREEREAFDEKI